MDKKKRAKPDDEGQSKLFIEKARAIGADETHSAIDELLERLAKLPPQPKSKTKSK